jgi:hypothetical protein
MLHWNLKDFSWERIFDVLFYIMDKFTSHSYSIGVNAFKKFYLEKHYERLNLFQLQLRNNVKLSQILFDDSIYINNKNYKNISLLNSEIENRLIKLYDENDFCIMHGDFCFNNILYDLKSNIIRLIDARGSFGDSCKGIYGDQKYDLAKITHSAIGRYDFLVNNLFNLNINYDTKKFEYNIVQRNNYSSIVKYNKKLISTCGYVEKDILFLVGLLFISMCPLHNDDIERQIVMYLHGIKFINKNL